MVTGRGQHCLQAGDVLLLEETEVKSLEGHQQSLVPVLSELIHSSLSLEVDVTFPEGVLI